MNAVISTIIVSAIGPAIEAVIVAVTSVAIFPAIGAVNSRQINTFSSKLGDSRSNFAAKRMS